MATINISLPESMKDFVDSRVTGSGYSTTSEYFRNLVREDQRRREQEKLEALLLEGLESGPSFELTEKYLERKKAELLTRFSELPRSA